MKEKIAVFGSGTMGSGIAHVAVEAGFQVNLENTEQVFVNRGNHLGAKSTVSSGIVSR
jgi:3-hydroxyacyl-CoA dehydrogenase